MTEWAIVDAYTESEQAGGFHVMLEQELDLLFETTEVGVTVSVKRSSKKVRLRGRAATEGQRSSLIMVNEVLRRHTALASSAYASVAGHDVLHVRAI